MSSPDQIGSIKPSSKGSDVNSLGKTKPTGTPRAEKNFRKIIKEMTGNPDDEIVDAAEEVAEMEESEGSAPTLFDLSKTTAKPLSKPSPSPFLDTTSLMVGNAIVPKPPVAKENDNFIADESLEASENEGNIPSATQTLVPPKQQKVSDNFSLSEAGRQTTAMNSSPKKVTDTGIVAEEDSSVLGSAKKDKTKVASKASFSEEQPDLSAINPYRQNIAFNTDKPQIDEKMDEQTTMRELAARIIEKIQVMRTQAEGKTSTIIELRYPPILAGSTVTLTVLDGAKREFNLSFASLSDAGKVFLNRKITEDNLSQILERKGIIIHTMTTSTLPEISISTDTDNRFTQDDQREQQKQKRQNQTFDSETTA